MVLFCSLGYISRGGIAKSYGNISLNIFIYSFFREGTGGRKRGREMLMCGCLLCAPNWGPGTQPRHVP